MSLFRLTKQFNFSASFSRDGKTFGYNYVLGVTVLSGLPKDESFLTAAVETAVIKRVHTSDLTAAGHYFKMPEVSDLEILKAFHRALEPALMPLKIYSLCLQRDQSTLLELVLE